MVPFEQLGKGVVKRTEKRMIGLFIDGTSLDRASRRINRKVDMAALVRGVTSGMPPTIARYYTLIPFEDDSRQRAFLDALDRVGLQVIVKRLPPKGVTRHVSVDVEMAADIIAFAMGHSKFSNLASHEIEQIEPPAIESRTISFLPGKRFQHQQDAALSEVGAGEGDNFDNSDAAARAASKDKQQAALSDSGLLQSGAGLQMAAGVHRVVTVVCPSRDISYPIALARELGADTVSADFGQFNTGDLLKSAAKWIDLSDSETIWRS